MADGNSNCSSDIKKIHNLLISDLVTENVGHDGNTDTFVIWNTAVKNVTNAPVVLSGTVMKQFQYLELTERKFSPGKYDFLKETFSKDPDALSKITKAEKTIKSLLSKNDPAKMETSKKPAAPRKKDEENYIKMFGKKDKKDKKKK